MPPIDGRWLNKHQRLAHRGDTRRKISHSRQSDARKRRFRRAGTANWCRRARISSRRPRRVDNANRIAASVRMTCCIALSAAIYYANVISLLGCNIGDGHRQIGRPEPDCQRRLRVVENRSGGQRDLVTARRALPPPMRVHAMRPHMCAAGADEPVRPAAGRQVLLTGFFTRKLEIAHILRKRRPRQAATLHMMAC